MSNQLVKYDDKTATEIQEIVSQCSLQQIVGLPEMKRAFVAASGVATLRRIMTDRVVEEVFMPLQGSQLGFRTDKDSGQGYPVGVVRECLISAFMHGVWGTGNEFNIIAGNMYITKNGMNRLVREFPGVSDVVKTPGVPHVKDNGALVPFVVSWKFNGQPREMRCEAPSESNSIDSRIPVRVNNGMGLDAILGKAERKALARVYSQLIGTDAIPEGDASEIIDGAVTRPALNGSRKATRTSAENVLGSDTPADCPAVPKSAEPIRDRLLKCKTSTEVSDLLSRETNPEDEAFDALIAVGEWLVDTGRVKSSTPGQGSLID